jgi:dynein assembly factor 5
LANDFVSAITTCLTSKALFEFREAALREAALLMIRAVIDGFPAQCKTLAIQRNLLFSLLFLLGRCPGETDVVPEAAHSVLCKLSALDEFKGTNFNDEGIQSIFTIQKSITSANIQQLIAKHFMPCFHYLCPPEHPLPAWELSSPIKAAFVQLLTHCPKEAWVSYKAVLDVIVPQIQHSKGPEQGSTEANMLSYASVRGEEVIDSLAGAVDVRLSLIITLEELIKAGTSDWQCSEFIAASAEKIFSQALTPNLVWRVGRVEATVRKVALAACYAMLKAGAVRVDTLYKVAPELVPLITSHLDDHDTSPRHIGCLCLTVVFERLKGAFGDQAIHEMYPKLLKRLDDSSDAVRLAICGTLQSFLLSAPKSCFSGTTLDYTLDQLFIHLDDPDPTIQDAVLQVIVKAGKFIDKDIVFKKANNNKSTHRSPAMCEKVISEVQGYEILS